MSLRRQATLYLPAPHDRAIELVRAHFNPAQFTLIRAHVALCRDDEVSDWDGLASRLMAIGPFSVPLRFDEVVRKNNLVYLRAIRFLDHSASRYRCPARPTWPPTISCSNSHSPCHPPRVSGPARRRPMRVVHPACSWPAQPDPATQPPLRCIFPPAE